jgi:hypothetical protein
MVTVMKRDTRVTPDKAYTFGWRIRLISLKQDRLTPYTVLDWSDNPTVDRDLNRLMKWR